MISWVAEGWKNNRLLAGAGVALGTVALVVIAGWLTGTGILTTLFPGANPMVMNTAAGFLLLGAGAIRLAANRRGTAQLLGGFVTILGVLVLVQLFSGRNLGIDELLWPHQMGAVMSSPGRMGPNTAACFILAGLGLIVLARFHFPVPHRTLAWLGGAILGFALLALIGYLSGLRPAQAWGRLAGMSLPTALNFSLFAAALLHTTQRRTEGRGAALPLFAVATVMLTATAAFSLLTATELLQANQWSKHTLEVRQKLTEVQGDLAAVATTAQAATDVPDDRAVVDLHAASSDLRRRLAELSELVEDNPAQLTRADELTGLTRDWLAAIARGQAQPGPEARAATRRLIDRMFETEAHLLQQRDAEAEEAGRQMKLMTFLGNGLALALIAVAYYFSRRAQDRLRESELRFTTLAARAPVGIYMGDRVRGCTYVNPRWCEISGLTPAEAAGEGWQAFIHPDDRERVVHEWPARAAAGAVVTLEYRARHKDGRELVVMNIATYLPPMSDGALPFVGTVMDVTAHRRFEHDLRLAKERAEMADRAKSAFLANMSHEIRTPMNGIVGFGALLLSTNLSEQQREWISYINSNGQALLDIINDILDLSKIEAGRLSLAPAPFALRPVLDEAVVALRPRAQAKDLTLTAEVASGVPDFWIGDAGRLRQILINLIGNAVKFTERGGVTVQVKLGPAAATPAGLQALRVEVRDTGIGIPEEVQRRLFARFTQADESTTRKYGGTGLGLSISKALVEQMHGVMELTSRAGEGSTFAFTIALEVDRDHVGPKPGPTAAVAAEKRQFKGVRIIVAEDNAVNRKLIEGQLRQLGLVATFVADGGELLERVRSEVFDLILMDVDMPVLDGIETTRRLRATPHYATPATVPIVALTAHAMGGDRDRCIAAGMDDYLSKPTKLELLSAAIARATAKPDRA